MKIAQSNLISKSWLSTSIILNLLILINLAYSQPIGGHLKYQANFNKINKHSSLAHKYDARINASLYSNKTNYEIQAEALGVDDPNAQDQLLSDRIRLLDLSHDSGGQDGLQIVSRIDRAQISYFADDVIFKLGRQALSWGNGLVFSNMDLFNPFAPTTLDKDYKTGEDALFSQYNFQNSGDLQFVALGRRDPSNHELESQQSSFATKWHSQILKFDYDLLFAQHFGNQKFGLGITHALWGAIVRSDFTFERLDDSGINLSLILNIDRSWVLFEHNFYSFLEYYHNDLGSDVNTPTNPLLTQLNRGDLFTIGKDYLAIGLKAEVSPLVNLALINLVNLRDKSGVAQVRLTYDFMQDMQALFGLYIPYGEDGSEFGGFTTLQGQKVEMAVDGYARISWYF